MFRFKTRGASGSESQVLFADIAGSTELYEDLGDVKAKRLIDQLLEKVADVVRQHEGKVVKHLGDGVLSLFENRSGLQAALGILDAGSSGRVRLCVGLHCGPVLIEPDDIYGDTVNTAARLSDKARAGELLVSKAAYEASPRELRQKLRSIPPIRLKGKLAPIKVYSCFVQAKRDTDVQLTVAALALRGQAGKAQLLLRLDDAIYMVKPGQPVLLGRSVECNLHVDHNEASRLHAKITYQDGAFVLEDTSTNGTYIVPDEGAPVYLQRQEQAIFGRGRIYLGNSPDLPSSVFVTYQPA